MKRILLTPVFLALTGVVQAQCELLERTVPPTTGPRIVYGFELDLDGDRLAARAVDAFATRSYVDVLRREGVNWVREARLQPASSARFGEHLALQGDTLAVSDGAKNVLVYERVGGAWVSAGSLLTPNGLQGQGGGGLALDGSRIIVGSIDPLPVPRAFVFEKVAGNWEFVDTIQTSGTASVLAVDLEGDRALLGTPNDHLSFTVNGGAAYVFEYDGVQWNEQVKLIAETPVDNAHFGTSLSLEGDRALIGAPGTFSTPYGGGVHFFERRVNGWEETQFYAPAVLNNGAQFGLDLELEGSHAAVGSHWKDLNHPTSHEGLVYLLEEVGGVWSERTSLQHSRSSPGDNFGESVSMSGDLVVANAPKEDLEGPDSGAVYGFSISGTLCRTLESFPPRVSLTAGGTQTLLLRAGNTHAGRTYLVAGSLSEIEPGFRLRGSYVPLNIDSYFGFSLRQANQGPLVATLGTLNGSGNGTASVTIPSGTSLSLAGLRLAHAFVAFENGLAGSVRHVSNPALVRLDP